LPVNMTTNSCSMSAITSIISTPTVNSEGCGSSFAKLFHRWQLASSELRQLQEKEQDKEQQRDFLHFQLSEIRKCNPVAGEDEQLVREREQLKSADTLRRLVGTSSRQLNDLVNGPLVEIRKNLEQAASLDGSLAPLAERIASSGFELEDLAGGLRKYLDAVSMDPARLDSLSERLTELKQLQRKYGPTLDEVIAFAEKAESTLALLESLEEEIARAEVRVKEISAEGMLKAAELTRARREAAKNWRAAWSGNWLRSVFLRPFFAWP
jgi:DNA repair protein RecN (Recombination protein N)